MGPSGPADSDLPQLSVAYSERDGAHVVTLGGELDLRSADELEAALGRVPAGEPARICVDLSELQFIDSTGLAILVKAHQDAAKAGGGLAIVCVPGAVRRTFETTGLMGLLSVVGSVEDALKVISA
jgi:anti-anti-sigma factor